MGEAVDRVHGYLRPAWAPPAGPGLPPPFLCSGSWVPSAAAGLAGSEGQLLQWLACSCRCSSTLTLVSTRSGGSGPGSSLSLPARLSSGQPAGVWLASALAET